jgi:hypothetical protein
MGIRAVGVVALALLGIGTSAGAAASPARPEIRGIVPHTAQPALRLPALSGIAALPSSSLTFDSSYETLLNRYFTDVAHDSGTSSNVYSVATQYSDNAGNVQYQSAFGGFYVDHDPLPANGCDDGADTYCLTDQQLQAEIQTVLTAKGWHGGLTAMFFLMTPDGVGSCADATGAQCTTNDFCAYHNYFVDSSGEDVIYANEPYAGTIPGCTGNGQGFPNDADSDATINTISHEHNEALTDPITDQGSLAWIANDGSEIGDLCAYDFGTPTGGTPGIDAYDQQINGHHYDLQLEFSNADGPPHAGGCVDKYPGGALTSPPAKDGSGPLVYRGGPVMHTNTTYAIYWLPTPGIRSAPVVSGTAVVNQTLTSSTGSWGDAPTGYSDQWQRCSSTGTACVDIPDATASRYRLTAADGGHTVRSTVRATNVNGESQPVASAATSLVIDVPSVTKAPHVSGHAHVGRRLTGHRGSWTYAPTGYHYQWLRCNAHGGACSRIRHATRQTYSLTRRDAGHRLRIRITAANAAGSRTVTSAATARIPVPRKR